MKVQLVSATYNAAFSYMRKFLGLGYIQACAQSHPDVARDCSFRHDFYDTYESAPEAVAAQIAAVGADLVAFGTYTWNVRDVLKICRILKEGGFKGRVLLGGPEVSYHHQKYMAENPAVDMIGAGEGELLFRDLLLHMLRSPKDPPRGIAGLNFRWGGELCLVEPREFHANLDELPSPFLTGALDVDELIHSAYFQTTRGCPFTCTYCDYGRNQPYYEFSLDRVRQELEFFKRRQARAIFSVDATFNYRRGRANEILKMVADMNFEGMFAIEVFPSLIDDDMVELLKRVKLSNCGIGIQTANPVAMRNIRRIWSPARMEDKLDKLAAMPNVLVSLELIMGLPGDNLKTFKETLDWSYARRPHHIFALPLQILSRTPLEHQLEEFKIEHSGPDGGEEILSNYSFGREEVMVGKAIVNWHRLLQPIVFRLRHLLDVKPSDFLEGWAWHAYYHGLHERVNELHKNVVPPELLETFVKEFRGFVQAACRERGRPDLSPQIGEMMRYLLVRRALSREGAFFVDVLDVSCMTTSPRWHRIWSVRRDALPPPDGLDPMARLRPTGPLVRERFDFDIEAIYGELDGARMAAAPVQETAFVFFRDPYTGAGRAVKVDDFADRLLAGCTGETPLRDLADAIARSMPERRARDESRSVAQVLIDCGVLALA
jgi:radical SAM superfamily enzyme YgiQ (UPF0313 family)